MVNYAILALEGSLELFHQSKVRRIVGEARHLLFNAEEPPFPHDEEGAKRWLSSPSSDPQRGRLRDFAAELSRLTGSLGLPFEDEEAALFILTGLVPYRPPVSVMFIEPEAGPRRAVLVVNYPWVPGRLLLDAYRTHRRWVEEGRLPEGSATVDIGRAARALVEKELKPQAEVKHLLELVDSTPGLTWPQRWRRWRELYPEWADRYANHDSMRAAYHGARKRRKGG